MTKKTMIFVLLALIAAVILFSFLSLSEEQSLKSTPIETNPTIPSSKKEKTKKYIDQSGVTFEYPENFVATPESDLDSNTYSSVIVSSMSYPGSLKIKVEDSNVTTLNDWFVKNKVDKKNLKITKTKLADLDAQQFQNKDTLTTIALDKNVLFTFSIELKMNKEEWVKLNDSITKSFAFTPPPPPEEAAGASEEDIIYEGEEVIE
ncbi:hypothetical protein HYW87_04085 [Candidatus Roizmanbacteria bacterium]|nr:hypothetical protein [Candidatus Roizmanbacteria bacterium]